MKLAYAPEAIDDLIRLRTFIEVKNPLAAQRAADALLKGINQLQTFPELGVEVQQAPNPELVRDLIIGHYIARYLIHRDEINILRIWHQRENH